MITMNLSVSHTVLGSTIYPISAGLRVQHEYPLSTSMFLQASSITRGDRKYRMLLPLPYHIEKTVYGEYLVNLELDLYMYIDKDIDLNKELLEDLVFIYEEYGLESDDNLTLDGIELKKSILKYLVEDSDG